MATLEELQKQIEEAQKKADSQRYFDYRHYGGKDNDYKYTANFDFEQALKTGEKKSGGQYQSLTGTVGGSSQDFRREHYGGVFDALGKYAATKSELTRLQKQYADMQKNVGDVVVTDPEDPPTDSPEGGDDDMSDDTDTTETNITQADLDVVKKVVEQAGLTKGVDPTLPTGTKIKADKQTVADNELLKTTDKKIDDPTDIVKPDKITVDDLTDPEKFDAAKVTPDKSAREKVGEVDAAQATEEQRQRSQMQAAQGKISPEAMAVAATQELDPRATTRYQLAELFKGMEEGSPPPAWAAPAVRKVTAVMQQRGLGASSMAAAATMQAMMESGIPIAAQDAQKYATIQLQNLNNEQQSALQNAAALVQMDMANLNNRQQAAVNNAKAFLTLDTQDLTMEQQANTLTYQARTQTLLSDQAAENAAQQFNAKSNNEINTFFTELGTQLESTQQARTIALKQFNSNQGVAIEQYNAQMDSSAAQFNANMQLQIDQSNAVWRRNVNTRNTATQNETNRQNALNLLGISQTALNNLWAQYRDKAAWVAKISENAADRAHNAAMQSAAISANASAYSESYDNFMKLGIIDKIWRT